MHQTRNAHGCSSKHRAGSLYVTVLGVTLIVSMMALSAMHVARLHLANARTGDDRYKARLLAASAIEHAMAEFNSNPNWQTDYSLNTEYPAVPVTVDSGSFTWRLISLGGSERRLDGIGRIGEAECILSVDLEVPLDLGCALLVDGNITVGSAESITVVDAPLATNANLQVDGSITGDVEAQTVSGSGTIAGTSSVPGSLRVLPDPATVFDYYLDKGTVIVPPLASGSSPNPRAIEDCLLSPASNPFGTPNPDGIYVVDTQGRNLVIRDCRIVGTLIVTKLDGKQVRIRGKVNWEPAYPNFPALLVDGDLKIGPREGVVDESSPNMANLNPLGTPFQGSTDVAKDDTYISSLAGLFYCSGELNIDGKNSRRAPDIRGLVIAGGNCNVTDLIDPVILFDPMFASNPPPGFTTSAAAAPTNLLTNSGFESGTTDWIGSTCSIVIDPGGDYYSGAQSLACFGRSFPSSGPYQDVTAVLQSGVTYDLEAWANMTSTTANIVMSLRFESSGSGTFTISNGATLVDTQWTQVTSTLTPTWTGTLLDAKLIVHTLTSFEAFRLDDVSLKPQGGGGSSGVHILPGSWRQTPGP